MKRLPSVDVQATGQNIYRLRTEKHITVKELQDIFGFSTPQAIYRWQNGVTLPTIDNLVILSSVFQQNLEDILVIKR